MGHISITWKFQILDIDEYHEAKKPLLEQAAKKPEISSYEYFLQEDEQLCHMLETFESSEAAFGHLSAAGEDGKRFIANVVPGSLALNVYGDPSSELRELLANFGAKFFGPSGSVADLRESA